jgi:hypothetical protein
MRELIPPAKMEAVINLGRFMVQNHQNHARGQSIANPIPSCEPKFGPKQNGNSIRKALIPGNLQYFPCLRPLQPGKTGVKTVLGHFPQQNQNNVCGRPAFC